MIANVRRFENVIRKCTINHLIDYVQLNVTPETISSKLINSEKNTIAILNMKNEVFLEMKKGTAMELNFDEPASSVVPYLSLIEEDEAIFEEKKEKIQLVAGTLKSKITLCQPQDSKIFGADAPKSTNKPFVKIKVNEIFREAYNKIKKIAPKFNKVYFTIEDGVLYIETTDKTNPASNGIKVDVFACEDEANKTICFPFKNFNSVMSTLEDGEFSLGIYYIEQADMGMISFVKEDESEKYYVFSVKD